MGACASRPRALPGDRSGRGHPLSPRECPHHPLTPARHLQPKISGPLPQGARTTWAGVRVTGLSCWKPADPSVQSSPLRRSPCSSIRKRVPPYGWKNGGGGGEAPRSRLLSEPRLAGVRPRRGARQARGRHPHQKPPSVQRAPPCRYLASITGSLGSCLWNGKLSLPLRGPRHFPWTTPPSSSPIPAESQCQGRSRDLRPGRGAGHGSAPDGAVQAGVTHAHGRVLPWGVRPAPRLGG